VVAVLQCSVEYQKLQSKTGKEGFFRMGAVYAFVWVSFKTSFMSQNGLLVRPFDNNIISIVRRIYNGP
jgi:hypothetical protein